jgi:hypothetical protein
LVLIQPGSNLIRGLLVVDFDDDERAMIGEELRAAAQDFVLAALHIDLQQLWRGFTGGNKVVERDCRYAYELAAPEDGGVSIGLDAPLRSCEGTPTEGDSSSGGARPYSGVHDVQAIFQLVPRAMVAQARDVFRVTIESYDTAGVAHQQSSPERHNSDMRTNVVENGSRPKHGQDRILHVVFVLSAPDERFCRKAELHPHSLRQARFNPHPDMNVSQKTTLDQLPGPVERSSYAGPAPQHAFVRSPLENGVRPVKQEVKSGHRRRSCLAQIFSEL